MALTWVDPFFEDLVVGSIFSDVPQPLIDLTQEKRWVPLYDRNPQGDLKKNLTGQGKAPGEELPRQMASHVDIECSGIRLSVKNSS